MEDINMDFDIKSAKKPFSRIGFALVLFFVSTLASQILFSTIIGIVAPEWIERGLTYTEALILSSVTMYLIGFPVFLYIIRPLGTDAPKKTKCSVGTLFSGLLISVALLYIGQMLGDTVFTFIYEKFGVALTSETLELISNIKWYEAFIFSVIIGPLVEELMFRKLIIDRTRVYGEKLSMIFSALMFAFFHMSIQQFFYAFLVGLLYAYLYLRRGNIIHTVILHAVFNFFGSVLPLIIYEFIDLEAFLGAADMEELYKLIEENLLGYSIVSAYSLATIVMAIAGFAILLRKYRKAHFENTAAALPKDTEASVAFMNVGVVLFIILSIVYPFLSVYMQR